MAFLGRESERDAARAASYAAWFARQQPLALPSLLLSFFSLTHLGTLWVDGILGVILGVLALAKIREARRSPPSADPERPARTEGRWLAVAGIVVGAASLAIACVIYFVLPPRA